MAYSSGKNAYGICDISGFRYKLNEMKKTWNGLLVGKDEFETKHPQLEPTTKTDDPQALKNARPEPNLVQQRAIQHGFNPVGFAAIDGLSPDNLLAPSCLVGTVEVVTT